MIFVESIRSAISMAPESAADQFEDLDLETFELSEINIDNDTGIIIAMNQSNTASVIKILEERGICEYVQYEA